MQLDMYDEFEEAERNSTGILPSAPPDDINAKMEILLAEFHLRGYITTYDAERIVHRGQAAVGEMRNRGHVIETTAVGADGVLGYVYRGFIAGMKRVPASCQQKYYSTKHWKSMALARKEIDGFTCVQCKSTQNLETHHWRYNLFNENPQRDLVTLCEQCHKILHRDISGSKVHFPRYVSCDIYDRISANDDDSLDPNDRSEQGIGEGDNATGCAECEGCRCGNENAAAAAGAIFQDSEPSGRTETSGGEEGWDAPF